MFAVICIGSLLIWRSIVWFLYACLAPTKKRRRRRRHRPRRLSRSIPPTTIRLEKRRANETLSGPSFCDAHKRYITQWRKEGNRVTPRTIYGLADDLSRHLYGKVGLVTVVVDLRRPALLSKQYGLRDHARTYTINPIHRSLTYKIMAALREGSLPPMAVTIAATLKTRRSIVMAFQDVAAMREFYDKTGLPTDPCDEGYHADIFTLLSMRSRTASSHTGLLRSPTTRSRMHSTTECTLVFETTIDFYTPEKTFDRLLLEHLLLKNAKRFHTMSRVQWGYVGLTIYLQELYLTIGDFALKTIRGQLPFRSICLQWELVLIIVSPLCLFFFGTT
jgi:hypothetical protein